MFESLKDEARGSDRKTWVVTTLVAAVLFSGVGGSALWLLGQKSEVGKETEVDVTFVAKAEVVPEPEAKPAEAPPPPPAPVAPAPRVAAAVTGPAAPPGARTSRRRAFQAPTAVPTAAPLAVDPVRVDLPAILSAGGETPTPPQEVPKVLPLPDRVPVVDPAPEKRPSGPVTVLEPFEPPRPESTNVRPEFPGDALRDGREGEVVIEVRIGVDGLVSSPRVVAGVEPFVSAALTAVSSWRYTPALMAGRPVEVARRIRVPFKVRG